MCPQEVKINHQRKNQKDNVRVDSIKKRRMQSLKRRGAVLFIVASANVFILSSARSSTWAFFNSRQELRIPHLIAKT